MALTRKLLSALGIEADKIEQIIEAHSETVDALKKERDGFKAKADSFDKVKTELDELKEAAKNSGDYNKLKEEYDKYKQDVQKKETLSAKKEALRELAKEELTETGIAKALKFTDFDTFELDDKGAVKDAKTLLKSLKDEWSDYVKTSRTKGADTPTPPSGGKTGSYGSKDEIMAIKDTSERQKAIAANLDLFR